MADDVSGEAFAQEMLGKLTLEEKVLLLTGQDMWRTNAIPRLGISRIKTSDGPVGVRGGIFTDGVKAASLPTGVSLAATWSLEVIQDICKVLISEAKSKEVDVLLGPTICIPRNPLGGRNFESYSEDPLLTGKLAARFINTLQEAGVGACVKHFAANDQEDRRFFIDEKIPPRALREIHLQAFQIAIRESDPWALMTAYNKINGTYCSANDFLLNQVLRNEWGWDGLVMSDWFGTNSVVPSLKAGMDLEMPGPVRRRGQHLIEAHRLGLISTAKIDLSVGRLLRLLHRTGKSIMSDWQESAEKATDLPEHREILRRAGNEGIVLLKNDKNLLPLENLSGYRIAVVGPHAARSIATGGGSSNLVPHYRTTPFESLKKAIGEKVPDAIVETRPGITTHRYLPLLDPAIMKNPVTGESGCRLSFWRNLEHAGKPFMIEHRPSSNLVCYDGLPPEMTAGERYSYRGECIITSRSSGMHWLSLSTCGPGKLILDGNEVLRIDRHWWSPKSALFMSYGSPEEKVEVYMEAGKDYHLILESLSREPKPYDMSFTDMLEREEVQDGGRIGLLEPAGDPGELFRDAVDLCRKSDVAIVVVGKDQDWETETSDMVSMSLPGLSDELISAVAGVNPNVIVVNQTGSPILMPWLGEVSSVIQAWYQGQEQGNCIADILLGEANPSGKLPITFPRRIEDTPSFGNYPGENDIVYYGEGIYVGYRFYDHRNIEPLFPFGTGLSYTKFRYSNIRLSTDILVSDETGMAGQIEVQVDIENTGDREGKEVVQFYVAPVSKPRLARPSKELKAFDKVQVKPGEIATARAVLDRVSVSYWDDSIDKWVIEENAVFKVIAASNSRENGLATTFRTSQAAIWVH